MMNFIPRPGQKEVLEYKSGKLAVPAVPGAGKTTVLANLAADLIAEKISEEKKILIVTYMNSAVANFRRKIGNFLSAKGLPRSRGYSVKTLHSLALGIIKEKPEARLINQDFEIIENALKYRWIRELCSRWTAENSDRLANFFSYEKNSYRFDKSSEKWKERDFPSFVISMISHFKMKLISSDDLINMIKYSNLKKNNILAPAAEIYAEYELRLSQSGLLDFDDLVQHSLKLLQEDSDFAERIASQYAYIFEDEAQDSNKAQEKMLYLLLGENDNLVRVGDSNQAITGTFTLSDPSIFRDYCSLEEVNVQTMAVSSRSSQDIIDLANYLVKWNIKEFEARDIKPLEEKYIQAADENDPFPNPKPSGYKIGARSFENWKEEKKFLARQAVRKAAEDNEKTTAVLMPIGYQLEDIASEIIKLGGDYQIAGSSSSQFFLTEIEVLLKFLTNPDSKENIKLLFEEVFENVGEGVYQILDEALTVQQNQEILFPLEGLNRDHFDMKLRRQDDFEDFFQMLNKVQGWLEASLELPPDELVLFLAERIELEGKKLAVAQNLALEFGRLLKQNPAWKLDQLTAELPSIRNRIKQFAETLREMEGFEASPDRVNLSTLHKAKGMEWDTVFIGSITSDQFQHSDEDYFMSEKNYLSDEIKNPKAAARAELEYLLNEKKEVDPDKKAREELISERLRLLYVGITRAKENLFLSTHNKRGSWEKDPAYVFNTLKDYINEKSRE